MAYDYNKQNDWVGAIQARQDFGDCSSTNGHVFDVNNGGNSQNNVQPMSPFVSRKKGSVFNSGSNEQWFSNDFTPPKCERNFCHTRNSHEEEIVWSSSPLKKKFHGVEMEPNFVTPEKNTRSGRTNLDEFCAKIIDKKAQTGSAWLQKVVSNTPEKVQKHNGTHNPPDSTKKKCKKQGFAESLTKLISSWESDQNMFAHQHIRTEFYTHSALKEMKNESGETSTVLSEKPKFLENSNEKYQNTSSQKYMTFLVKKSVKCPNNGFPCTLLDTNYEKKVSSSEISFDEVKYASEKRVGKSLTNFSYELYLGRLPLTSLPEPGDIVTVFAPWQSLTLSKQGLCAVFSSFYQVDQLNFQPKIPKNENKGHEVEALHSPVIKSKIRPRRLMKTSNRVF